MVKELALAFVVAVALSEPVGATPLMVLELELSLVEVARSVPVAGAVVAAASDSDEDAESVWADAEAIRVTSQPQLTESVVNSMLLVPSDQNTSMDNGHARCRTKGRRMRS